MVQTAELPETIYGNSNVADVPIYTFSDVAHHLRLTPEQTARLVGLIPSSTGHGNEERLFTFRQLVAFHLRSASFLHPSSEELTKGSNNPLKNHALADENLQAVFRSRVKLDGKDPVEFYPFTLPRLDLSHAHVVTINPHIRFGRPMVKGIPTAVLAGCFKAGDSSERIGQAYRISSEEVEEALRFESGPLSLSWRDRAV